jgi:GNAT superfamily N-acetyltransferase
VVLPDYQGVGIGMAFLNAVAASYAARGDRMDLITTTPQLTRALARNPHWALTREGRVENTAQKKSESQRKAVRLGKKWAKLAQLTPLGRGPQHQAGGAGWTSAGRLTTSWTYRP